MKKLILAVCLSAASMGARAQVAEKVDRFTGASIVKWEGPSDSKNLIRRRLKASSQNGVAVFFMSLLYPSYDRSRRIKYISCHNLDMLVDGAPVETPDDDQDIKFLPNQVGSMEIVTTRLPRPTLEKLASMKNTMEFRVCNDEYGLWPEEVDGLRDFAAKALAQPDP